MFTSWAFAANCFVLGNPPSPGCAWVKRWGGSHKGTPLCFGAAQTQLTERDTMKMMMMMLSLTLFVPCRVGKDNKKDTPFSAIPTLRILSPKVMLELISFFCSSRLGTRQGGGQESLLGCQNNEWLINVFFGQWWAVVVAKQIPTRSD